LLTESIVAAADRRKAQVEKLKIQFGSGAPAQLIKEISAASIGNDIADAFENDDWNALNEDDLASGERLIYSAECEMIFLMTAVKGRLDLTSAYLSFRADLKGTAAQLSESDQRTLSLLAESEVLLKERKWPLSKLREAYFRRYMLRSSAIEFFFTDRTNYLFNFTTAKDRIRIFGKILQLRPLNLITADSRNPMDVLAKSSLTERWQKHEISNFEYLMHLNTISGRTYNDLTQYPIFPW
jgi:hypothetical protein